MRSSRVRRSFGGVPSAGRHGRRSAHCGRRGAARAKQSRRGSSGDPRAGRHAGPGGRGGSTRSPVARRCATPHGAACGPKVTIYVRETARQRGRRRSGPSASPHQGRQEPDRGIRVKVTPVEPRRRAATRHRVRRVNGGAPTARPPGEPRHRDKAHHAAANPNPAPTRRAPARTTSATTCSSSRNPAPREPTPRRRPASTRSRRLGQQRRLRDHRGRRVRRRVHRGEPQALPRRRLPEHVGHDPAQRHEQAAFEHYYERRRRLRRRSTRRSTPSPDWPFFTEPARHARRDRRESDDAQPSATIKVADRVHDASKVLPERWHRTDRYYNFTEQRPRPLARAGHGRRDDVRRGGTMGARPPGHLVQGLPGRALVLHRRRRTTGDFAEPDLRRHLAARSSGPPALSDPVYSDCGATVLANYQQTKISAPPNLNEPIGFDQLPDGRIIQTARGGRCACTTRRAAPPPSIATLPVYTHSEDGLYGPAVDNDFAKNKWVYLYYSPPTVTNVRSPTARSPDAHDAADQPPHLGRADLSVWDPWVGLLPALALQVRRRPRTAGTSTWTPSRRSCGSPSTAARAATSRATSTSTSTTTCGSSPATTRRPAAATRAASSRQRP